MVNNINKRSAKQEYGQGCMFGKFQKFLEENFWKSPVLIKVLAQTRPKLIDTGYWKTDN